MNFSANSHWRSKGCYGSFCVRRYSYISKTLKGKSGRKRNDSRQKSRRLCTLQSSLLFCCRGIFQKAADMRSTFSFMKKCTVSVLAIHTVKTQRNRLRPQQIFFRLFLASERKGSRHWPTFVACFQRRESLFTRIKRRRLSLSCRYELLEQQHVCIEL